MEVLGSIYTGVSDKFQMGVFPIARCVKAENHDLGVVLMNEVKVIGQMDNTIDHTFESANREYDVGGCAPTMNTCAGGGLQPKILESQIVAMRGRNPDNPSDRSVGSPTEQRLEVNMQGTSNCLTSVQKDNLVMESQVLTPKRTEYGKQIRKSYESGMIKESRHNMTELEPRQDGLSNTLTTVQKDNIVLVKQATKQGYTECELGGVADLSFPDSATRRGRVQECGNVCPTIMAQNQELCRIETRYRIRKLTPRECGRLMGVSDEDIDKMAAVNSNTQLYKQFGNSIVVDVMCAMFKNLNIDQKVVLKSGDTIKCSDAEDMIKTMNELEKENIHTDFLYEKDGEKGYWLEIL